MRIKNLVVTDLINPMTIMSFGHGGMEESEILTCRICRKEKDGYIDLESNNTFSEKQEFGYKRVDEETVTPLSDYYNFFGMKKKNKHQNKKEVYQKVKTLKKEGKFKTKKTN